MKKMSLQEVARRAGVGLATVDRVLNERGGVSPETVSKVLQVARESGLNRILPEEHRHPWQIEVLLSGNDSFSLSSWHRTSAMSPVIWVIDG